MRALLIYKDGAIKWTDTKEAPYYYEIVCLPIKAINDSDAANTFERVFERVRIDGLNFMIFVEK